MTIDKDILKVELYKSLLALQVGQIIPQEGQITEDEFNQLSAIYPCDRLTQKISYNSDGTISATQSTEDPQA